MTDAPTVIYAAEDKQDGWRWPMASKYPIQHHKPFTPYVLASALPDKVDIYRAIKKSGARKHADIAAVVADLYTLREPKA